MVMLFPENQPPFFCYQHNIYFSSEELYKEHVANCLTLLSRKNVCRYIEQGKQMCGLNYETTTALIIHFLTEHGQYLCNHCDRYFSNMHELETHRHNGQLLHESKIKPSKLIQIILLFLLGPIKCPMCGKTFKSMAAIQKHQMMSHNPMADGSRGGNSFFSCEYCPHVFWQSFQLKTHQQEFHTVRA